jgi:hypothetical protein
MHSLFLNLLEKGSKSRDMRKEHLVEKKQFMRKQPYVISDDVMVILLAKSSPHCQFCHDKHSLIGF